MFPLRPDGKRDVDHSWKLVDTWKQMEAVLKKGTLCRAIECVIHLVAQAKLDQLASPTSQR
jgi:hypothetical protein